MMMYLHIDGINHLAIWNMDIAMSSTVADGQKIGVIGENDDYPHQHNFKQWMLEWP